MDVDGEGLGDIVVCNGLDAECLALSDWSDYSGNYGKPGIIASTTSARGSTQFSQMEDALSDFLETKMIVLNSAENVMVVDLASSHASFQQLVDRMDRLISALWRGSDLSTLSRSDRYGASVQLGEAQILEEDDAELITETLQKYIDARVIEYTFGRNVPVLAGVTIQQTPKRGTQQDMLVDRFLVDAGMPLSVKNAAKRNGRAIADPGEPILQATSDQQRAMNRPIGMTEAMAADGQLAPTGNRDEHGNVLDRPSRV